MEENTEAGNQLQAQSHLIGEDMGGGCGCGWWGAGFEGGWRWVWLKRLRGGPVGGNCLDFKS